MLVYRIGTCWYGRWADRWMLLDSRVVAEWFTVGRSARELVDTAAECAAPAIDPCGAPVADQEVWCAGVTYERSRAAREHEAHGSALLYAHVYHTARPQLFFKSVGPKCVGHGGVIGIRDDSSRTVPEPELAVVCSSTGQVIAFTLGNDVTACDIEAQNPLFQPQAKCFDGSCALGPALFVPESTDDYADWILHLSVQRKGAAVFEGDTSLRRLRRPVPQLVSWLFANQRFPNGVVLLTGTGIVTPDEFRLEPGDDIEISTCQIGTLRTRADCVSSTPRAAEADIRCSLSVQ